MKKFILVLLSLFFTQLTYGRNSNAVNTSLRLEFNISDLNVYLIDENDVKIYSFVSSNENLVYFDNLSTSLNYTVHIPELGNSEISYSLLMETSIGQGSIIEQNVLTPETKMISTNFTIEFNEEEQGEKSDFTEEFKQVYWGKVGLIILRGIDKDNIYNNVGELEILSPTGENLIENGTLNKYNFAYYYGGGYFKNSIGDQNGQMLFDGHAITPYANATSSNNSGQKWVAIKLDKIVEVGSFRIKARSSNQIERIQHMTIFTYPKNETNSLSFFQMQYTNFPSQQNLTITKTLEEMKNSHLMWRDLNEFSALNRSIDYNYGNIKIDTIAPIITSGSNAIVTENSGSYQKIYTAIAYDNIGIEKYSISGSDSIFFEINEAGEVYLTDNPSFDSKSNYNFEITAIDYYGNKSIPKTVNLHVLHENKNEETSWGEVNVILLYGTPNNGIYNNIGEIEIFGPTGENLIENGSLDKSKFSYSYGGGHYPGQGGKYLFDGHINKPYASAEFSKEKGEKWVAIVLDKKIEVGSFNVSARSSSSTHLKRINDMTMFAYYIDFQGVNMGEFGRIETGDELSNQDLQLNMDAYHLKSMFLKHRYLNEYKASKLTINYDFALIQRDSTPPIIISGNKTKPIEDKTGKGKVVYTINAVDASIVICCYNIMGDDKDYFILNEKTGEVTLKENANYDLKPNYIFQVTAEDTEKNICEPLEISLDVIEVDEIDRDSLGLVRYILLSGTNGNAIFNNIGEIEILDHNKNNLLENGTLNKEDFSYRYGGGYYENQSGENLFNGNINKPYANRYENENTGKWVLIDLNKSIDVGSIKVYARPGNKNFIERINQMTMFVSEDSLAFRYTGIPTYDKYENLTLHYSYDELKSNPNLRWRNFKEFNLLNLSNNYDYGNSKPDTIPPLIISKSITKPIEENSGYGQRVYTVKATDKSGIASYEIIKNRYDGILFSINQFTGEVTLDQNPDFETKSNYSFEVIAKDAADNLSTPVLININIIDLDESRSTSWGKVRYILLRGIENNGIYNNIGELEILDSLGINQINNGILDKSEFHYYYGGGHYKNQSGEKLFDNNTSTPYANAYFSIEKGEKWVMIDLAREIDVFMLRVSARSSSNTHLKRINQMTMFAFNDLAELSFDFSHANNQNQNLQFPVTLAQMKANPKLLWRDLNEFTSSNLTIGYRYGIKLDDNTAPKIISDTKPITIKETDTEQAFYTIEAEDQSGILNYIISGTDKRFFNLDPKSGVLTLINKSNLETKSSYIVEVSAQDRAGNICTPVPIIFNVLNIRTNWGIVEYILFRGIDGNELYNNIGELEILGLNGENLIDNGILNKSNFIYFYGGGYYPNQSGENLFDGKSSKPYANATFSNNNGEKWVLVSLDKKVDVSVLRVKARSSSSTHLKRINQMSIFAGEKVNDLILLNSKYESDENEDFRFYYTIKQMKNTSQLRWRDLDGFSKTNLSIDYSYGMLKIDKTPPVITSGSKARTLFENSGRHQVIYRTTVDDMSPIIKYKISGSDARFFEVDSCFGEIRLSQNPDFELKSSYHFTLTAIDDFGNISLPKIVSLAIVNVYDNYRNKLWGKVRYIMIRQNNNINKVQWEFLMTGDIEIYDDEGKDMIKNNTLDISKFTYKYGGGYVRSHSGKAIFDQDDDTFYHSGITYAEYDEKWVLIDLDTTINVGHFSLSNVEYLDKKTTLFTSDRHDTGFSYSGVPTNDKYEDLELNSMIVDMKRDTTLVWRDIPDNYEGEKLDLYSGYTYSDGKNIPTINLREFNADSITENASESIEINKISTSNNQIIKKSTSQTNSNKNLVKIVNLLGQEVRLQDEIKNRILIYIFDDGTIEKRVIMK